MTTPKSRLFERVEVFTSASDALNKAITEVLDARSPWQLLYCLSRIVFLGLVLYLGWILVVVQPDLAKRLMLPAGQTLAQRYGNHREQVEMLLRSAIAVETFGLNTLLRQVPLYDTSNVTTMESLFSGCKSLESVPLFDTRRVTTMRWMFSSCSALASLPQLDLRALESMEGMFGSCYGLVTLPLLNTEAVTTMAYCFSGC
jgi:surface protein